MGLQVTTWANVDISFSGFELYKYSSDPYSIYSIKKPIISGCISLDGTQPSFTQVSITV